MSRLSSYLQDPVLKGMYDMVRSAGAVRPISLDLTAKCNLRCTGCYYYAEGMDLSLIHISEPTRLQV